MVSAEEVKSCLKLFGDYSDEELEKYDVMIEEAAESVKDETEKAAMLAAARLNYKLALINGSGDGVTSFKAGDVSITQNDNSVEYAKSLFEQIAADCPELSDDSGFAFRTV